MTVETGQQGTGDGGAAALVGGGTGAEHPAAQGGTPSPAGQTAQAPWAETADGMWNIGEQPWYSTIPEADVRGTMEAKGYKNPGEVAMAYSNLLKLQNGNPNVIALPGDDATPEQLDAFMTKLGRPATPDDYKFEFGEGVQVDENMMTFGRNMFHKIGLNPKQAQAAAEMWNEFASQETTRLADEFRTTNTQEMDALKSSLGDNFDKALAAGRRVVQGAKVSNATIEKVEAAIGTAAVVELLTSVGMASQEGGFVGGGTGTGAPPTPDQMTPAQAQAEITKLNGDAEFQKAYQDANDPGHQEAVQRMQKLFARV